MKVEKKSNKEQNGANNTDQTKGQLSLGLSLMEDDTGAEDSGGNRWLSVDAVGEAPVPSLAPPPASSATSPVSQQASTADGERNVPPRYLVARFGPEVAQVAWGQTIIAERARGGAGGATPEPV